VDCCIFFDSVCSASNQCGSATIGTAPDGSHCASADFCNSGNCQPLVAGPPPDGRCVTPTNGCVTLSQGLDAGQSCCPGTVASPPGSGSSPTCCLPQDSYCYYANSCCSGECKGGRCVPAGSGGGPGDRCLSSPECSGALLCDPVSRTCTNRWCMAAPLAHTGCCSWNSYPGSCNFPDGGTCLLPGTPCTGSGECCSGSCTGSRCDTITFF
jgi:hypothetical protein